MKYGNRKTLCDGILFDSKKEAQRWRELQLMEKAHMIQGLERQKVYTLIPTQKGIVRTERPVKYIADFVYYQNGQLIVEDVKGMKTPEYIIKRKLMRYVNGIEVREV